MCHFEHFYSEYYMSIATLLLCALLGVSTSGRPRGLK